MDDASTDETAVLLGDVENLIVHRNPENLGFLHSCNRGAGFASGEYLVFLNNDTIVKPGWLDALVETFELRPDAGLVGSQLLYPDGTLQEAGGVIWKDASGRNCGNRRFAADPRFNYLRAVDYCSGASIMLRRETFAELGGFSG